MPASFWICSKCQTENPPYTEVCRECGERPTESTAENGPSGIEDRLVVTKQDLLAWPLRYPSVTLFALAGLSLLVFRPASGLSSPGFIVVLFGLGTYPFVSVLRGLASVFRGAFRSLSIWKRLHVVALNALLLVTSSGAIFFAWVFLGEYYGQLTCTGAGCAQGGLAVFIFLPVAWVSYFATRLLCAVFVRLGWWPPGFVPSFS